MSISGMDPFFSGNNSTAANKVAKGGSKLLIGAIMVASIATNYLREGSEQLPECALPKPSFVKKN